MTTATLTNTNVLAFVEAQCGYQLSETQIAVLAMTADDVLACIACVDNVDDPLAAAESMEQTITTNAGQECSFVYVSKNPTRVLALKEAGYVCFLGVGDDAELAYWAEQPVAPSRQEFAAEWAYQHPLAVLDPPQCPQAYDARRDTVDAVMDGLGLPEAPVTLVSAFSGPLWLRDAVMIKIARAFPDYQEIVRAVAQGSDDPRVLAPVMFAALMGGNELIARVLSERIDPMCEVPLVGLVRRCLDAGIARCLSTEMTNDELFDQCLRSGLDSVPFSTRDE